MLNDLKNFGESQKTSPLLSGIRISGIRVSDNCVSGRSQIIQVIFQVSPSCNRQFRNHTLLWQRLYSIAWVVLPGNDMEKNWVIWFLSRDDGKNCFLFLFSLLFQKPLFYLFFYWTVKTKVIIEKSRGGRFLRIEIWAGFGPNCKISCFHCFEIFWPMKPQTTDTQRELFL